MTTEPLPAGTDQSGLLDNGILAVQSTPLLAPDGSSIAVLSTHHADADTLPDDAALRRLDEVAAETGRWLSWYRNTVVFNALEYLHGQALRS